MNYLPTLSKYEAFICSFFKIVTGPEGPYLFPFLVPIRIHIEAAEVARGQHYLPAKYIYIYFSPERVKHPNIIAGTLRERYSLSQKNYYVVPQFNFA